MKDGGVGVQPGCPRYTQCVRAADIFLRFQDHWAAEWILHWRHQLIVLQNVMADGDEWRAMTFLYASQHGLHRRPVRDGPCFRVVACCQCYCCNNQFYGVYYVVSQTRRKHTTRYSCCGFATSLLLQSS